MRKYELVILLHGRSSEKDRESMIATIESQLGDGILKKDDIGFMQTAYDFSRKAGNNKMYYLSYYIELDPTQLSIIKKEFKYLQGLERYYFYLMGDKDVYMTMKESQDFANSLLEKE